jgi:hypothetical protein
VRFDNGEGIDSASLQTWRPTMGPYPVELRQRVVEAYLEGEGTLEEVAERTALARLMETDRPAIHRLLDPNESGMTLTTLVKAMHVLKVHAIPIVAGAFATKPQRKRPVAAKPVVRSTTRKDSLKSTPSKTGSTGFSSRRRKA